MRSLVSMSTLFESGCLFNNKDTDGDNNHDHQDDLMLAAELGKSLLERNRELDSALKATQDYAEEQCAQAEFYLKQVEILREENETSYHTCEQLEANNQILSNRCEQWRAEFKLLEGKNTRLWELINSLEKRIEELTTELNTSRENITETTDDEKADREGCVCMVTQNTLLVNNDMPFSDAEDSDDSSANELEIEMLRKQISELNIQLKLIKLHKGEFECQLEDVVNENQLLYNKISILNQEINEWENFAQKEENYRRLAAAFTLKHCIETESDVGNIFEKKSRGKDSNKINLKKARSCECLSDSDKNMDFLKSPNLVNNILSSVNSSSFLSELDTEYSELVKRYETLLEKYKQEGKLNENPDRTRKVQKAIQTLSLDFSNIPVLSSPVTPQKEKISHSSAGISVETSPVKRLPSITSSKSPKREKTVFDNSSDCCEDTSPLALSSVSCNYSDHDNSVDYRLMFSEIFAKLKESKEVFT